jgi:DNA-directed RNA polymerase alpha subunit/DNA-binding CsgD family transcriptional regulator
MAQSVNASSAPDQVTPLKALHLSTRAYNALRRDGIDTIEQALSLTDEELLDVRNLGSKTLGEIKEKLTNYLDEHPALQELKAREEETEPQPIYVTDEPSINFLDSSACHGSMFKSQGPTDEMTIDILQLSNDVCARLKLVGVTTVEQLTRMSPEHILDIPYLNENSLTEIKSVLESYFAQISSFDHSQLKEQSFVSIPLGTLGLSTRAHNALMRSGIRSVNQLAQMSSEQILEVRNLGQKSLTEIEEKLEVYLAENPTPPPLELPKQAESESELELPPPLVAPALLACATKIPLDDISVSRLALSTSWCDRLHLLGIESLGDLIQKQIDSLGQDFPVGERLNRYLTWLIEQDEFTWAAEISGERISPIYRIILAETALDDLMESWLEILRARDREIIQCRMGCDGPQMTLTEIGERMGVTRERIRQIESRALRRLSWPHIRETLDPLIRCLIQAFTDAGGLMTEAEVEERIVDLVDVEAVDVGWATRLLLVVWDEFQAVTRDGLWGLESAPLELVPQVRQRLLDVLHDIDRPVSRAQMWDHFRDTVFHRQHSADYDQAFVEACLRTHPQIECVEGTYMTREGRRQSSPDAEVARSTQEKSVSEPGPRPTYSPKPKAPSTTSKPVQTKKELVIDLENVKAPDRAPETLDEWELYLRSRVSQVELLGEIALTDQERVQLGQVIGQRVRSLGHGRGVRTLRSEYPCALSVYLVAQGVYGYEGGDYWTDVIEMTGFKRPRVSEVGRAFEKIVEALALPLFYDMRAEAHRYVSLILAHGGIPNYCLPDFFNHMLQPSVIRAAYADMSAAELIDEWRWRPGIVEFTDKPVTRFLIYGGRVAEDFVERCREMVWTYLDTGSMPDAQTVGLPQRVVAAYGKWIEEQGAEQVVQDTSDRWRLRKPQVLVDPWGEGVLIDLPPQQVPATEIYADIEWQVTADEAMDPVPVHVRRRGFDRKTEAETLPLPRPAENIAASLLVNGESKRTWRYRGIDEEHPLLVFDPERGRLLSWTRSLPASPLGLLYPADFALQIEGDGRLVEELPRLPWGWSAFRGEIWDLTRATRLILSDEAGETLEVPIRPDEAVQRPTLVGGRTLLAQGSDGHTPVYVGAPPRIRVPLTGRQNVDEALALWRLHVRNRWSAIPEVNVAMPLAEFKPELTITDRYVELPLSLPSLLGEAPYGNFSVRLRGPLGRDAAFTLRIIPHFDLCGHEALHLPTAQDGSLPVVLLAETLPGDRIACQGEDVECQVRVTERGDATWQHEVEIGADVTDVELTVVHPHPSGETVRVPIRVPIRRLRWALVDEEQATRRGAWAGTIVKRPIEALEQLQSPFLLIKLPLRGLEKADDVQVGLRLLDVEGNELQATNRKTLVERRLVERFDLSAFLDTIRASRSPVLRLELTVWGLPGRDRPFRLPVLSLTKTLFVEDVDLSFRVVDHRVIIDLAWREPVPLKNRRIRFWPLWRPWDPVFEQPIPDEAEGTLSFPAPPSKLKSGKYRLEFLVVDPWTSVDVERQRPSPDESSTVDVEMIAADRQLGILNHRIQGQGQSFEMVLERVAICQNIGAVEKAAPDRQWCYQHLDDGAIPQQLSLLDLARDAGDDALIRSLQLKLFAAHRIERLMAMREAGDISADHFRAYLANLPRSGMLPVATCQCLLAIEDETVRLHAVQQLIRRENRTGPETIVRWVEDAELSDADAVAILVLNAEFSAQVLKERLGDPAATRLLKALAPELGDKTPIVQPGTWIYNDAGWGRIVSIEDQRGNTVQQFLSGQTEYRLHVILRPAIDAEPILVDLKRELITFTEADVIHTCGKCKGFSARDCHLIVGRHDRVAHDGISPSYKEEKITRRSLRRLRYSARPPLRQGLGLPESLK